MGVSLILFFWRDPQRDPLKMNCKVPDILNKIMIHFRVNNIAFIAKEDTFKSIFKGKARTVHDNSMTLSIGDQMIPENYVTKFVLLLIGFDDPSHHAWSNKCISSEQKDNDIRAKYRSFVSCIQDTKLATVTAIYKFICEYCRRSGPLKRCLIALKVLVMCELRRYCIITHTGFQLCYFGTKHVIHEKYKEHRVQYYSAIQWLLKISNTEYHMAPEGDEIGNHKIIVPWSPYSAVSHEEILATYGQIQACIRINKSFKVSEEIRKTLFPFHRDQLFDKALCDGYLNEIPLYDMTMSIMAANRHYLCEENVDQMSHCITTIFDAMQKNNM